LDRIAIHRCVVPGPNEKAVRLSPHGLSRTA
jgi:hypothetical protein